MTLVLVLASLVSCSDTGGDTASTRPAPTGGSAATGGDTGTGGRSALGGAASLGGTPGTGGASATGGDTGTGGRSALGGAANLGGTAGTGGASAIGGSPANGGSPTSGGAAVTGGWTGASGSSAGGTDPLPSTDRPVVIVTTDGENDDQASMIRYLAHASDYSTLGLIYTNSQFHPHGEGTTWIDEQLDAYEACHANLVVHDPAYPSPAALRAVVRDGIQHEGVGMAGVGDGRSTAGSTFLAEQVDESPGPVWVLLWGGASTLAQALFDVRATRSGEQVAAFVAKLRVYGIDDAQDDAAPWIRDSFPGIQWLMNGDRGGLYDALRGASRWGDDPARVPDPWFRAAWMSENVTQSHGALGARYPFASVSEGDSESFMHLMNTGLRSTEDPTWGGWGGRFRPVSETLYRDLSDTVGGVPWYEVFRWIEPFSNEFEARMDYFVASSYAEANHPPRVAVAGGSDRVVSPSEEVALDATASTDPDGDALSFRWWQFSEADGYDGDVAIATSTSPRASVVMPNAPGATVHVVLEVRDDGSPALTRYARVVLTPR